MPPTTLNSEEPLTVVGSSSVIVPFLAGGPGYGSVRGRF